MLLKSMYILKKNGKYYNVVLFRIGGNFMRKEFDVLGKRVLNDLLQCMSIHLLTHICFGKM